MKVLMLSREFMKSHYRAGEATFFRTAYITGRKIHTIRENESEWFRDGETVSLRQWTGQPYRSKQREIESVTIRLEPISMIAAEGKIVLCHSGDTSINPDDLAANDGLEPGDFFDWFFPHGAGNFLGDILHFTDFTYSKGGHYEV